MKNLITLLIAVMTTATVHAEMQLTCRTENEVNRLREVYSFVGATSDLQQATEVHMIRVSAPKTDSSSPARSVGSDDPNQVVAVLDEGRYPVLGYAVTRDRLTSRFSLGPDGDLKITYNPASQKWNGFFVAPGGREIARSLLNCELENPEPGFTVRN